MEFSIEWNVKEMGVMGLSPLAHFFLFSPFFFFSRPGPCILSGLWWCITVVSCSFLPFFPFFFLVLAGCGCLITVSWLLLHILYVVDRLISPCPFFCVVVCFVVIRCKMSTVVKPRLCGLGFSSFPFIFPPLHSFLLPFLFGPHVLGGCGK